MSLSAASAASISGRFTTGPRARLLCAALYAAIALIWLAEYRTRGLWEPDEPRYAYVAREMMQTGHWLMPTRNGLTYAHKPPLMFWLISAFAELNGGVVNDVVARLPSLLGGLLSLWAARRMLLLWGHRAAAVMVLPILSTTFLFWYQGGRGQIDSLLCGLQMAALYLLFRHDAAPRAAWRAGAFALMGLAMLAKGPVGLVVPLGAYACAAWAEGRARALRGWFWLWGPAVALLFPAAWLVAAWLNGAPASFLNEVLFAQNVGRVTGTTGEGHTRLFTYYLHHLPAEMLPWTPLFVVAMLSLWRRGETRPLARRLGGWMLFIFVFFSAISTKRQLYILLIYPAAAMAVATALEDALAGAQEAWARRAGRIVVAFLGVIAAAAGAGAVAFCAVPGLFATLPDEMHDARLLWFLPPVVIAGGGAVWIYGLLRANPRGAAWPMALCAVTAALQLQIVLVVNRAINPLKVPLELAAAAQARLRPDQKLLMYHMPGEAFAYAANRPGQEEYDLPRFIETVRAQGRGIAVFMREEWDQCADEFAGMGEAHFFQMGGKDCVWLEFDLAEQGS